jgi:predicted transposase YbfD/YdcC
MVSAWASGSGLVLGQMKVDDKSNEIPTVSKLLEMLEIKGCIVTLDALHCQTKTVEAILGNNSITCCRSRKTSPGCLGRCKALRRS